jgi:uncharacterized protein YunC (DUF1805 family)
MLSMRIGFSLFLLAVAIFYTYIAFEDLNFMVRNRLGPGFFPRVIGVVTIALLAYSLFVDVRQRAKDVGTKHGRDMVVFTAIAVGYVALLPVLGGLWATIAFMLTALFVFNPGKVLSNVLVSVILPVGLYLLFDTWLNSSLPSGMVPFP